MPKISTDEHTKMIQLISMLEQDRQPFWQMWRDLANYILPQRYVWLQTGPEQRASRRNSMILDGTGTTAARTLASGMMSGVTSPARPWFQLGVPGLDLEDNPELAMWLDDVESRMQRVLASSNFYNGMATQYLDLVVFGTSSMLIYEHPKKIIHCHNPALGEFYLGQDSDHIVNIFSREFTLKIHQVVREFGEENVSDQVRQAWKLGGARLMNDVTVVHLIEPNDMASGKVGRQFSFKETYWDKGAPVGEVLRQRGYFEFPGVTPRWELAANDCYGSSPGLDALPDIIQLQHETKKKAQGLDKMMSPPLLADVQLEHKPMALLPNGVTFVPRLTDNAGARPIYTVNPPLGDMTIDIRDVQARIREIFHNDLFMMISQLDTVRSATEIDARREEKLIMLGPVLERFEQEALDPALKRVFGIMQRRGMIPPMPEGYEDVEIEIEYISILSVAQSAVGTAPTERLLQLVGNLSGIFPEAKLIPNVPELLNDYALDIGVKQKNIHTKEQVAAMIQGQNQQEETAQGLGMAAATADTAKVLSETDVGGGANALQQLLGGLGA